MKRLFFLVFTFLPTLLGAEDNRYIIRSVTANDGLSNNAVRAVLCDSRGFVWFGTSDGLNRYDGRNIRQFSAENSLPDNNFVLSLCEDDEGLIWVGTEAGLCYYDHSSERLRRFVINDGDSVHGDVVAYQVEKARDGSLWIPHSDQGFVRIDPSAMTSSIVSSDTSGTLRYCPVAVCFDNKGDSYFISSDGNLYVSSDNFKSARAMFPEGSEPYRGGRIHRMLYAYGYIFPGGGGGGEDKSCIVDVRSGNIRTMDFSSIQAVNSAHNQEVWVASDNGIVVLDSSLDEQLRYTYDNTSRFALKGKAILSVCEDHDGGMWAGTFSGGHHLIRNRTGLVHFTGHHVRSIVPDSDGTIWLGTENHGLLHYSPQESAYENVRLPISSENISSVCPDGDWLWIGAFSQNDPLIRMNRRTGAVQRFPESLRYIYCLAKMRDGGLVIGSVKGLQVLRNGEISDIEGFRHSIHEVLEDTDGYIWVSTAHNGLWRCSGASEIMSPEKWVHYSYDEGDPGSIPSNKVSSVFEDSRGHIWVTTETGGFCRMEGNSGKFRRYDVASGFPYNCVNKISEDSNGLLWITTGKGLLCLNPETDASFLLTVEDGMLSNQYSVSSNIITPEGLLYTGSSEGLVCFDPIVLTASEQNSRVLVTSFCARRRGGAVRNVLAEELRRSPVFLRHDENSFSLEYSTINNNLPKKGHVSYILDGYDDGWSTDNGGYITYTRIPAGHYTLRIKVENWLRSGEASEYSAGIVVEPPIFLKWPAIVLYLTALVLIFLLLRRRLKRRMNARRFQMEQEHEKKLYTAKFEFLTNISHELRTLLTLIQGPVQSIMEKMPSDAGPELMADVETISRSSSRLNEYLMQLMVFKNVEKGGYSPNPDNCDLCAVVNDTYKRFVQSSRRNRINLRIVLPDDGLQAFTDKGAVEIVVSNLLSNAVKYAETYAVLSLSSDGASFSITLENDGEVVPVDKRESIFKPFVRFTGGKYSIVGNGIGLSNSRSLASAMGGSISMDADTSVNRFLFTAPLILPTAEGDTDETVQRSPAESGERTSPSSTRGKSMLIVEDNADMREFLVRRFSPAFDVRDVCDGNEALAALAEGELPSIIISDVMMPNMDGFEFCRQVKNNIETSHLPIILLTAKDDIDSKIQGLEYGADAYIEKPFQIDYLATSVKSIISNRERILKHLVSNPFSESTVIANNASDEKFINTLDEFIEKNISDESLMVEDLAAAACMSKSKLQRKMRSILDMSANDYLQLYRLKRAARLLCEDTQPVSEVSECVGFSSSAYFSTCFRKQFGMSPKDFRKTNQKKTL